MDRLFPTLLKPEGPLEPTGTFRDLVPRVCHDPVRSSFDEERRSPRSCRVPHEYNCIPI
jgi:hypothetical protein